MSENLSATEFWRGPFGDSYSERNVGRVQQNKEFFERVLPQKLRKGNKPQYDLRRVIELGCGTGENLAALRRINPNLTLWGVEINKVAADRVTCGSVIRASALDFKMPLIPSRFDLSISKGWLIHVPPDDLPRAYQRLYEASAKYMLIAEYHNPVPIEVEYRGHAGKLWKRDFAAEFMEAHPVKVVDYGFAWKHAETGAQDDLVWTLFRRKRVA